MDGLLLLGGIAAHILLSMGVANVAGHRYLAKTLDEQGAVTIWFKTAAAVATLGLIPWMLI